MNMLTSCPPKLVHSNNVIPDLLLDDRETSNTLKDKPLIHQYGFIHPATSCIWKLGTGKTGAGMFPCLYAMRNRIKDDSCITRFMNANIIGAER